MSILSLFNVIPGLLFKYYAMDHEDLAGGTAEWPAGEEELWKGAIGKCMAAATEATACDYEDKKDFSVKILSLIAGTCIDIIKVLYRAFPIFYFYG